MRPTRMQRCVGFVLACVIALASVQFATHSIRPDVVDPSLAAYLASGGSLDDLCLTGTEGHDHADCPFCRDVDFVAVLPPDIACAPAILARDPVFAFYVAPAVAPRGVGLRSARAPPIA